MPTFEGALFNIALLDGDTGAEHLREGAGGDKG